MAGQLQLSFVSFKKNAYIAVEGKRNADRFFIIREGRVRISREVELVEEEGGGLLGPGDFFGVVSTMSSHSHVETALAVTDVVLISVHREQYGELIQKNSPVALKILLQFSKRLRYLDEALSRFAFKNTAEADASHLFNVGEYYLRQSQYRPAFYAFSRYVELLPGGENALAAREKLMKIAIYVKEARMSFEPDEFNRFYAKDAMLFAEGEPGDELFIIQKGSVKITKIVDGKEALLAVLKAGDIFGEMALLEAKPRAASAIAYEDCRALAVNKANYELMIKNQPQLVSRLTALLADRIWFIYKQLANTLIADPLARVYDALLINLEKNRVSAESQAPHTFDLGPQELASMAGLSPEEAGPVLAKLFENKKIVVENGRIRAGSAAEILRQAEFFKKMQRIEEVRQEARLQNLHLGR